jgi:hypothetical protein
MKPESRPSSQQGLASAVNLAGPLITSSTQRLFDNAGLPTTKPRDSPLRAVTKEVVGIHVRLNRSPFAGGIPRRLLPRVSPVKWTFAPLRF